MTDYTLDTDIDKKDLIEFDLFTVKDQTAVENSVDLKKLETSEDAINYALRQTPWRGYAYKTTQDIRIGYNTQQDINGEGLTEQQAYSYWLDNFKTSERQFKRLIGVDQLSQTQYDALVCLYFLTGDFKNTGSHIRRFPIIEYIRNKQWQYVATALVLSNNKRPQRQQEARIMMLADYGQSVSRNTLRARGIQEIRSLYPDRMLDDRARRQAELVYYKETKRFLPKMSQSRQRQIVNQTNI